MTQRHLQKNEKNTVTSRIDVYAKHYENTEAKMDQKEDTKYEAPN